MKKNNVDEYFKSRSHSFNEMPSDDLWKKIEDNLAQEPKLKSNIKKTFIPMALPIIVIITVASLYFNNNNSEKNNTTISISDSIKKEKNLVSNTNIQLKPTLGILKKTLYVNKTPTIITIKKSQLTSGKMNNSQSIIKKDTTKQDIVVPTLKNDSIINTKELVIESSAKTNKINNIQKEETHAIKAVIEDIVVEDNHIYNMVGINVQPEFIGGKEKLYEFIYRKYRIRKDYPEGKIYLSFIIEKNGSLSSFKVIKDIGFGSGEEAIRVLKDSPLWEPGEQNGKKVRVLYNLPITISRDDEE